MVPGRTGVDSKALTGLRILIVEDAFMIAEDLADRIAGWGCVVVGPDGRVAAALDRIERNAIDGALLDVNLGGEQSFGIAEVLAARNVPFVFLTGYDGEAFPRSFGSSPKLAKPVDDHELFDTMKRYLLRSEAD